MANKHFWLALASAALSLAMAVVVGFTLARLDWAGMAALVPTTPLFWLIFAATWMSAPVGDWLAFRQVWPLGGGGLAALARKQVYNELVLGYLGEAYFYTWAKRHVTDSPFGTVKDVAILSALAGNLFTLALLVLAWPQLGEAILASGRNAILWSLGLMLVISLVLLLAQRRVFSLPLADRRAIFAIHLARCVVRTGLGALMWYAILPGVELMWWFYLATVRQLVGRLPLVANKDLIFAGLAVLLLGDRPDIAAVMALAGGLLVAGHVVAGVVLLRGDLGEVVRLLRRGAAPE